FKSRIEKWSGSFRSIFGESTGDVFYAAKAFISVEVAKMINQGGISLDVCTGGELAVARAAIAVTVQPPICSSPELRVALFGQIEFIITSAPVR
ncbi:MAG: hypothetical protein EB019_01060, partial [Actinobacteria bacterium]|nr:hypothetical protein [Actinomycetota bacterium]